jgi:uncharacterized iron-regulated membrane protein
MSEPALQKLRILHRWIGLLLAFPLMCQGATGFILAATPPFEAMRTPAARDRSDPPQSIGAIIAAARADAPAGLVPSRYQAGSAPGDAAVVDLTRASERTVEARVFIDPGSLETLDWRDHPDEFYRWVHSLHETFLLPGPLGRSIVGWFGIGLLCLAISGIPIWWPRQGRWKAALGVPRDARGFRLPRALHGAAGGWAAGFLVLQSLSGISMAFPGWFGTGPNAQALKTAADHPRGTRDIDVDAVAGAVRATATDARLTSLRFPARPGRPMIATLQPAERTNGVPPTIVAVDPVDGRIISVRDPRNDGLTAGILAWLRALHSGDGLGPLWRVVVCLLGTTLPLLPITGIAMWLLRRKSGRRRSVAPPVLRGASE